MRKVVLLSRLAAGYDTDRYLFLYRGKRIVKFYGSRLTDAQAKGLFLIEQKEENYGF